jgi:hypothetical protein
MYKLHCLTVFALLLTGCIFGNNNPDPDCVGSECDAPCEGDECDTDEPSGHALMIEIVYDLVVDSIRLDEDEDVSIQNCSNCEFEDLKDGSYLLHAEQSEFLLIDIPVEIENGIVAIQDWTCDLKAETCTYEGWTGEGEYAVKFDKECTSRASGNVYQLYTEIEDGGDGLIHLYGPPNAVDLIITDRELSGKAGNDLLTGHISEDGNYVLFQQWAPDGSLYKEIEYDCP